MNHYEHPDHTHHSIEAVLQDPELKRQVLRHAVDLIAHDYKAHELHTIDRKLFEDAAEVTAQITGRSALITEEVLLDYIDRLKAENARLHRQVAEGGSANVSETERQIRVNEERIAMVRGNCLDSLVKATDKILFPGEARAAPTLH